MIADETEKLRVFQISVVTLAADLTSTVPLRPGQSVKVEMKARRDALRDFFHRWLACPWVGHPTEERMDELLHVLLEPGWLAKVGTVAQAVA